MVSEQVRDQVIDVADAGAPELLLIITGARVVGETVMLGMAQDLAHVHSWGTISETATARGVDAPVGRGSIRCLPL